MKAVLPPPAGSSAGVHRAHLEQIERRLEPLLRGAALADWRLCMGHRSVGSHTWQLRRNRLLSSGTLIEWTRARRAAESDPAVARRYELLGRLVAESAIEQHPSIVRPRSILHRRIAAFRPSLRGKEVDFGTVMDRLRTAADREERRKAWYAEEALYRPLERPLIELAALRNERARALGFRSFPEFKLGAEGFTVARLERLLEEAARHVRSAALVQRANFEDATGDRRWFPWDVSYAADVVDRIPEKAFRAAPLMRTVRAGVRAWGFGHRALGFRADAHDFSGAGIEIPVDPPSDVRVVYQPGGGSLHYSILFHEVGHALHMRSLKVGSPLVRWHEYVPGFSGFAEGIGVLFEQIPGTAEWLSTRSGIDPKRVAEIARTQDRSTVSSLAFHIAYVRAELELYRNPKGDIGRTLSRCLRDLGGYDAFEPLSFANSFYATLPVYCQSYLFAILFARQLRNALREACGDPYWPNPRVGPWLTKHWFRRSGEFDWVPHVKETTGRPFGARAFNAWAREVVAP